MQKIAFQTLCISKFLQGASPRNPLAFMRRLRRSAPLSSQLATGLYHACMNMAVALSWLFQQRSSLLVHQAVNSLFQRAWTMPGWAGQLEHDWAGQLEPCSSLPAQSCSSWPAQPGSTLFMPVNRKFRSCAFFRILLPVFIVMCTAQLNNGFIFASHVAGKNKTIIARCHELRGKHHDLRTATRGLFVQSKSYRIWCLVYNNTLFLWRWK